MWNLAMIRLTGGANTSVHHTGTIVDATIIFFIITRPRLFELDGEVDRSLMADSVEKLSASRMPSMIDRGRPLGSAGVARPTLIATALSLAASASEADVWEANVRSRIRAAFRMSDASPPPLSLFGRLGATPRHFARRKPAIERAHETLAFKLDGDLDRRLVAVCRRY
jgi:hypothetical protein